MLFLIRDLLVFVVVIGGLTVALGQLAARFDPLERLTIGVAAGVAFFGAAEFTIYATNASGTWHWVLAFIAIGAGLMTWSRASAWASDPTVRQAVTWWLVFVLWCVGGAALILTYNGGGWAGDWDEHYQRAQFFLHHWPMDFRFIAMYLLPARPPLANVATSGFLALTDDRYVQFQVFTVLLNSLVFFPTLLFARLWKIGTRGAVLVALGLMLNPSVMENATFAWTKLIATFYALTATYFLLRDVRQPDRASVAAAAAALAAGVLVHYSVIPWMLAFGTAWIFARRHPWTDLAFVRTLVMAFLIFALPVAAWVFWSVTHYGWHGTLASNTSVVTESAPGVANAFTALGQKIWNSIIPYPVREPTLPMLAQQNSLGWLRDEAFCLFQINLPGILGAASLVMLWRAWRSPTVTDIPRAAAAECGFWIIGILAVIPLGIGVHGETDRMGVAHICLQPLVALALAFGLARLGRELHTGLSRALAWILGLAAAIDLTLGIGLQWAAEAGVLEHTRYDSIDAYLHSLTFFAQANYGGKLRLGQPFLHDAPGMNAAVVVALLAVVLAFTAWMALRHSKPTPAEN
ncbi:MAG TPA: hypothetical protein VHD32_07605 [Candidatus Didemnitutus sp.]|nr:hypothetical protein [Candidatus Didemnitutus sp.]